MGIDASHPEPGSDQNAPSYHSVVGSMDGSLIQYGCYLSTTGGNSESGSSISKRNNKTKSEKRANLGSETSDTLSQGVSALMTCFNKKNNTFPKNIVVYRDGISDAQFQEVIDVELRGIKAGIVDSGCDIASVKITIVICLKRHHTRFFYENGSNDHLNSCPGVCVDASGGENSIVSPTMNEFYLNSHSPIQGTCNPCRYTVIHDEIGFKVRIIE